MKRIGMHYEQFCGDVPAPAWSELPPAINGEAEPKKTGGVSTDPGMAAIASEGDSPCRPAEALPPHAPPSTERDDPPFKVGDKVMLDLIAGPTPYTVTYVKGTEVGVRPVHGRWSGFSPIEKTRHPTPATEPTMSTPSAALSPDFLALVASFLPAQIGRASCRERVSSPV